MTNAFLFAWSPDVWPWDDLEESVEEVRRTGSYSDEWTCASHKKAKPGDRAFLVRVGKEPKGILGSGIISSEPFLGAPRKGKILPRMKVMLKLDVLLNPEKEPILTIDLLKVGRLSKQMWTPQSSGIIVRPEFVEELEAVWKDFLRTRKK